MLDFLALRAIPGVEKITDDAYWRTVQLTTGQGRQVYGWLRVGRQSRMNALTVTVDAGLLPVLSQVLAKVRGLFDLNCNPAAVSEVLAAMNDISPGLCVPGMRLPGCFDAFEMAVRAVLGQQITVKAARTLAARLVATYGTPLSTGIEGLTHTFPTAEDITVLAGPIADHLGPLGITGARARTVLALARAFTRGDITLTYNAQPQDEMQKLRTIPGIGEWTAQYIAMRGMGWPDAFLHTDHGVKKALAPRSLKEILALAENWRPYRAYAVINLWNSL